jgi:hypothetical protein
MNMLDQNAVCIELERLSLLIELAAREATFLSRDQYGAIVELLKANHALTLTRHSK